MSSLVKRAAGVVLVAAWIGVGGAHAKPPPGSGPSLVKVPGACGVTIQEAIDCVADGGTGNDANGATVQLAVEF